MNKIWEDRIILIAGDSWACGEWGRNVNGYDVIHYGLSEYLIEENYKIINLGFPGGGNKMTITRINDFLKLNPKFNIVNIIVFQTEWNRYEITLDDISYGYLNLKNKLISEFYQGCSKISTTYNIPVQLIGGCSDTSWIDDFHINYPGISIVCQSLTNLVLNGNHRIINPVHSMFTTNSINQLELFKKNLNQNDLKLLLHDMDQGNDRLKTWRENDKFFWPDGRHANRRSHKILFNFLKEQNIF